MSIGMMVQECIGILRCGELVHYLGEEFGIHCLFLFDNRLRTTDEGLPPECMGL